MRVLIAEDESISRRILESQLGKWGYEVVSARSGAEAWEILQAKGSPSLAILDWQMPEMDGIEATGLIRALERKRGTARTPIITVTAHAMAGDRDTCIAAGMNDYLVKPYSQDDLIAARKHRTRSA